MALNFMIHCGGNHVEREQIAKVDMPAANGRYAPIRHDVFADMVEDALSNVGFRFGETAHALGREGKHYFGMAELKNCNNSDEFALVAGWRSSYDKSLAASFVVGSQVFVCDNLAFTGEIIVGRRHTKNVMDSLRFALDEAVQQVKPIQASNEARYDKYKQKTLTDAAANHHIIEMYKAGALPVRCIDTVVSEFYEPSHSEFLTDGGKRTAWTLFNAVTESLKGTALPMLPQRTQTLHGYVDNVAKFNAAKELKAAA